VFLRRLDIQGFKSFPQRVRVDFGPGITSVVGPNGSGKTNIVEAIRWVLGEQNMRHLRGDTLEDVIFTGSAHRKALGMAEVALTMVNNRGVLPIEYTEISIARRTFRNGTSEYFLNRQPCRLRDLRDLFLDTGMGSHAYSLIERGMVDNVLSDESGHRRFLFEEAAGIMRYKTRKKEALQKLDLTLTDLTRVSDVMGEIEREVRSLARQVGKARRHGRLREEIRALDVGLAKEDWDRLIRAHETSRVERLAAEERRSLLAGDLARHEAELEGRKLLLLTREGEVRHAQEALAEHEAKSAALLNEVAVLRERRAGLTEKLEHARSEAERLRESVEETRRAVDRLQAEAETLKAAHAEKERELLEREAELESMKPLLESRSAALQERKQFSLDLFETRVQRESSARSWAERGDELKRRHAELLAQRDALVRDVEALARAAGEIEAALGRTREAAQQERERRDQAAREVAALDARISDHDQVEKRAREAHAALESRHATLRELKDRYEGYDPSVRSVVAGPSRAERILGTVGDVLHSSGEWLTALEAALGEAIQFIVAERTDAALRALGSLEAQGEGRATFIALDRLSRVRAAAIPEEILAAPGVAGLLLEHVRFEPGYVALASYLLSSVVVVDSIEVGLGLIEAFPQHRLHFVTRRGERILPPGIVHGGSGVTRAGSVLRREEELEALAVDLERSSTSLAEVLAETERLRAERAEARTAHEALARAVAAAEDAARAEETKRAEHRIRYGAATDSLEVVRTALSGLETDLARAREEMESATRALQSTDAERGELETVLAREEAEYRALSEQRERAAAVHAELRIEVTRARAAAEAAEREGERLRSAVAEAEREIAARGEEAAETERRIGEVEAEREQKDAELAAEVERKRVQEEQLQGARERFGALKGEADDLEAWTREFRREHGELTERLHRHELEHAEGEAEMRLLSERIRNEYEVDLASWVPPVEAPEGPPEGALAEIEEVDAEAEEGQVPDEAIAERAPARGAAPLPPDATRAQKRERLRYLQEKLRSLGPVNLLAVQDYDERRERLRFLQSQKKDLETAREELLTAIQKINRTASDLFLRTFEEVDRNFKQVFSSLFEGGEAALTLTGEDPLEAEIDILARPRGKKPQSLSLLSGGEKALTAIALLFAIYLVKPSPFCILDEVDAPLDDANIDRFVRLLGQFSEKTQFIVVTHNKKTMEVADCLYGVTMEEPGVSKLVSVQWNRGGPATNGERTEAEARPEAAEAPDPAEPVES
jgi:chromosome segregation protein